MPRKGPKKRKNQGNVHFLDAYRNRPKRPWTFEKPKMRGRAAGPTPKEEAKRFRPSPVMDRVRKYIYIKEAPWVQDLALKVPRWITPNGVTLFRGALVLPAANYLLNQRYWAALAVLAVAFFLDAVDGILAEARNQHTLFGKLADPIMDKVLVGGALLALWDVLSGGFRFLIAANIVFAIAITAMRFVKLWRPKLALRLPGIAASDAGKIKFNIEVASVLTLIIGLALATPWMVTTAFILLILAVFMGGVSFFTQFVGHPAR